MDGHTYGRTYGRKISPFYRTLSPIGAAAPLQPNFNSKTGWASDPQIALQTAPADPSTGPPDLPTGLQDPPTAISDPLGHQLGSKYTLGADIA